MPSSPSSRNRFEKQAPGENSNTWGTKLNTGLIDLLDSAIDGMTSFTLSGAKTLSAANFAADEARSRYLNITGGTGGTITLPNVEKLYLVRNGTSGDIVFTTGSGTTATIHSGNMQWIVCEGGNVVRRESVNTISGGQTIDTYSSEKLLPLQFTDATAASARQKLILYWPPATRLQGRIEFTLVSGWDSHEASGYIRRVIACHLNETGIEYVQSASTEAAGFTNAWFTISNMLFDPGNNRWYCVISALQAQQNSFCVHIRTIMDHSNGAPLWINAAAANVQASPVYTDSLASFPAIPSGVTVAGPIRPGGYNNGSYPAPAAQGAGAIIYSNTLGVPLYSNGASWKRFDTNAVVS